MAGFVRFVIALLLYLRDGGACIGGVADREGQRQGRLAGAESAAAAAAAAQPCANSACTRPIAAPASADWRGSQRTEARPDFPVLLAGAESAAQSRVVWKVSVLYISFDLLQILNFIINLLKFLLSCGHRLRVHSSTPTAPVRRRPASAGRTWLRWLRWPPGESAAPRRGCDSDVAWPGRAAAESESLRMRERRAGT